MRRISIALVASTLALGACAGSQDPGVTQRRPQEKTVSIVKGSAVADFVADAVYTDEKGAVGGVRWVHKAHGMPVTVLRIQSVPQVFLAFNTPPDSDRGEPHTGEHLLLGKGTKGKMLSAEQDMSLVESTAWTSQTDVCYSWSCAAGKETFYRSMQQYLDALLLPDFTDEEIRREVANVGPVKDEASGKLTLDEKGTIYQEMVSTYEKRWIVWDELQKRLWGEAHPLSFSSGGDPAAVRTVEPHHVRDFHAAHYHLGADTQMIVALPDTIPESEFLTKLSEQMAEVDARPEMKSRSKEVHVVPPGHPQADRSFLVVPYPNANEDDAGLAVAAWKPVPLGSQADRVAAEILLATLASGESSTLYRRLMDSATREVAVDAAEMTASLEASKVDLVPVIWFDQVPARNATKERMADVVRIIRDEIARVAALPAGSPELEAFNAKALVKLTERDKNLRKQLNSPPLFGHRGAGGFWLDHLRLLDQDASFSRSVTLTPVFATLRAAIAKGGNPWTRIVQSFGLADEPYCGVSVPSKAELEARTAAKAKRIEGYVADVVARFGGEPQEALAKFAAEYDAKTKELDEMEKRLPKPHLVADVPLVPDPSIHLEPIEAGTMHGYRGIFDNMTFVETSLSFPIAASEEDLPWLAILPQLLTDAGVVENGKPVPYDVAVERRAKEIYALSASFAMRPSRGRHELRLTASGADVAESKRAIDWIELCLRHPWIAKENLPRLRDLVAQEIQATRGRLGGSEESWVRDPAGALRWQRDPVYLASSSIHARLFLLARCEWRLLGAPAGEEKEVVHRQLGILAALGEAATDAKSLASAIDALVGQWKATGTNANTKWAVPIALRVKEMVGDMAPATLAKDVRTLISTCEADLAVGIDASLAGLSLFIDEIPLQPMSGSGRLVLTGSRANTDALLPRIGQLVARLPAAHAKADPAPSVLKGPAIVDLRLRDHDVAADRPVHYGLVNNAGTSGVFVHAARAAGLDDLDEKTLTDELASRVFGGSGPHAFFMKTWGSGLAYSNGLSINQQEGRISYYAERCPDLVQTMTFVAGVARDGAKLEDPYLVEYAVANAVTWSRESDEYEQRTRAAADDMVDGDTPERTARWRGAVRALKDRPEEWQAMRPRIVETTGRVLPGVGPASRAAGDPVFLTIAPEPMLARWEKYVQDHEGADERVHRIYGRDFWIVPGR